jgi:hypothetical protein
MAFVLIAIVLLDLILFASVVFVGFPVLLALITLAFILPDPVLLA